ncbi:MAG: oxalurate catabolism protein HpxZ [Betaproteobacteria bacterium]|nr:oxalurate catabolism protein HpxZ [Betaproteobacteria bacterium]
MDINNPQTVAEVTREFNRYQQAILNNDVAVLNELFWNNTLTLRYGIGENLYGYAAIAAFRGARDPASALRVVGKNVVTTYGRDAATTNCEFARGARRGRQSQSWIRMPEGWRIVAAHVSYMAEPKPCRK